MKCPKQGCSGGMYRFHPRNLVSAFHRADTGVVLELRDGAWNQVGFMCSRCGFMEFYAEDPAQVLREPGGFFEATEPGEGGPQRGV